MLVRVCIQGCSTNCLVMNVEPNLKLFYFSRLSVEESGKDHQTLSRGTSGHSTDSHAKGMRILLLIKRAFHLTKKRIKSLSVHLEQHLAKWNFIDITIYIPIFQ